MKSHAFRSISIAAAITAFAAISEAQVATDNAGNSPYQPAFDAWQNGDNGGVGFQAWTGLLDQYVGSSAANGDGSNSGTQSVDTPGINEAWALRGNGGGQGEAFRPFNQPLQVGQSFVLDFDNGYVDGGSVGFSLQTSGGANVFEFFYQPGVSNAYRVAGTTTQTTTQGFTDDGMRTTFTLLSATSYEFTIDFFGTGTVDQTLTGSLSGADIGQVRFFNFSTSGDPSGNAFYNNMSITPVPEPSTWAAGGLAFAAVGFMQRRRLARMVGRK